MTRFRMLLFIGLLNAAESCAAGSIAQAKGKARLEITWDAKEPTLELADLITVTVHVSLTPHRLDTPLAPLNLGSDAKWQLVKRSEPKRGRMGNSDHSWSITYHFAPKEPGKLAFLFPPVKYRLENGDEKTATWDPVEFDVTPPGSGGLRDATVIEALPPLPPADPKWWIVSTGIGLLLLLLAVVYVARRWLLRAAARTPADLALAAWHRLLAKNLHESGRSERFVTLLTMIVRRYVERQFSLPACRRTTPEFLRQLESCPQLSVEEKQFLQTFFERCDAVKFARHTLPAEECRALADAVHQFLERRANS